MDPSDLYGLRLERFTEERNALAKQLRQERRRDQAADVAKLRKPSVAAWAVNQLVRTQSRGVKTLFKVGDTLRKTQADLLAGRSNPGALRKAVEAERAAVDELTHKARGLLSAEGQELTAARLEQVSDTLHAAALDQDARTQVRDGCLQRELRHVGLGAIAPAATPPARAPAAGTRASPPTAKHDRDRATRLKAARKVEADARRQMARAEREVAAAEERCERAARALRQAEESLATARALADQRALEHRRAQTALGNPPQE